MSIEVESVPITLAISVSDIEFSVDVIEIPIAQYQKYQRQKKGQTFILSGEDQMIKSSPPLPRKYI